MKNNKLQQSLDIKYQCKGVFNFKKFNFILLLIILFNSSIYLTANDTVTHKINTSKTRSSVLLVNAKSPMYATEKPLVSIQVVAIPGGSFLMGSPSTEMGRWDREGPQHKVFVSAFYIGATEVTQDQFQAVMGYNPSYFKGNGKRPVEQVSWFDAVDFCNKLSIQKKLETAYDIQGDHVVLKPKSKGYRLPTEAEWEYACRAGSKAPFWSGNNIGTDAANYNGDFPYNNGVKGLSRRATTPVGSLKPNAWGLYDMAGNVAEWCGDYYAMQYEDTAARNPTGPSDGIYRVNRGGAWNSDGQLLRSSFRVPEFPERKAYSLGFRVAKS